MTRQQETCEALQQQVAQLTRQLDRAHQNLQRSREELQEFAYLASHDLQEPLRKIEAFGDLLVSRHGESLAGTEEFTEVLPCLTGVAPKPARKKSRKI